MKLFLLVCVSVVAGSPVRPRPRSPSVYDYYDFVEIPKTQPRSDKVVSSRVDGPLPRRVPLPRFSGQPRPRPRPPHLAFPRAPDYQLTAPDVYQPQIPQQQQFRPQPQFRPHLQYQQEAPVVYQGQPILEDQEYAPRPNYESEPIIIVNEPVVYEEEPLLYQERLPSQENEDYQQERPPFHSDLPPQEMPLHFQEEYNPQFEDTPHYEELPQVEEEVLQYDDLSQYEKIPQYEEQQKYEFLEYEEHPKYETNEPQHQKKQEYEEPIKKEYQQPAFNNFVPKVKQKMQDEELVKEKRQVVHGSHLDANGEQFVADASEVENGKGDGRLAFQIHGQQGPHSYRFGYDTGKGYNRQFRYEERDGNGQVHGRYGFYDKDGKLQVVNYSAHPEYGFSADVPH
ncbi:uncharacterized protein [Panulirus ornatus]|uniref:uncharacterized protein n=1 Tax=Panulirus ornatus TaxID=150431 RepID=UPI003A86FF5A